VVEWLNVDVVPLHKAGYILPVEIQEMPSYNVATQYIMEGLPTILVDKVIKTWLVVDKTTEVIESETEDNVLRDKLIAFKQSAIWTKIKNDQDLTNAEIQLVVRFITRYVVKKIGQG
jgi:hypothetical protein